MVDLFKTLDESLVDKKAEDAMKGLSGLSKMLAGKPLPLMIQSASTPGYHFVADLSRQFLRCGLSELQGEATVVGKVLRILTKGQTHEAFSLLPSSIPTMDRGARKRVQQEMKSKKLTETVRGPGAIIAAVAVYR